LLFADDMDSLAAMNSFGGFRGTANNRMVLMAVIVGSAAHEGAAQVHSLGDTAVMA
jgi:hypothetical protein